MKNRKLIVAVSVTVLFGCTVFATLNACSGNISERIDYTSYQSEEQENTQSYSFCTEIYSEENNSESESASQNYTTSAEIGSMSVDVTVTSETVADSTNTQTPTKTSGQTETPTTAPKETTESSRENTVKDTTTAESVKQSEENKTEHATEAEDSCSTESGEGTKFVFTSVKISNEDYDYYSYLVDKGYVPISSKKELAEHCRSNVLSLDNGPKNISYIITNNGLFDGLASEMENKKSQAERTGLPIDMVNRDSYLYSELGLDYQTYYSRGIALFMIKKIQNVTNNKGDYSVYAVYYYSYETGDQMQLVDSVVKQAVKNFSGTDFDKMLAAYDYLIDQSSYAENEDESIAHTAYGALVNKSAVCEGYAKAYKLMLDAMGIANEIVVNDIHAWNVVQYEDQWYMVDVTNGDVNTREDKRCYAYFMLGQDVMNSSENLVVAGYIFSSGTIADYGYIDGSNTDSHVLAEISLQKTER